MSRHDTLAGKIGPRRFRDLPPESKKGLHVKPVCAYCGEPVRRIHGVPVACSHHADLPGLEPL